MDYFCDNELCINHIETNLLTVYAVDRNEFIKDNVTLYFCNICKNAIDMAEIIDIDCES